MNYYSKVENVKNNFVPSNVFPYIPYSRYSRNDNRMQVRERKF